MATGDVMVRVSEDGRRKTLSVKVSNVPSPEHIGDLKATVQGVTGPEDAAEAYHLHMVAAAFFWAAWSISLPSAVRESSSALSEMRVSLLPTGGTCEESYV